MKRIAFINATSYGSTGNIILDIINGYQGEARLFCFRTKVDNPKVTKISINKLSDTCSHVLSRIDGKDGFHYHALAKKLIKELEAFKPDIIHIHNLHGYYLNIELLINYINKNHIKIIYTFHDLWSLTGRCAVPGNCKKYLEGCKGCKINNYPYTLLHLEDKIYQKKIPLLSSIEDMTIISPCEYNLTFIKETYLNKYPMKVINNGIDLDVFKHVDSDIREKYNIAKDTIILLTVANPFSIHKGVEYLNEIASKLDKDYLIIAIGDVEKGITLNPLIKHIPHISREELIKFYSAADLFINTTMSDTYPTVDMEAISCLLPVISFDTGGTREIVTPDVGVLLPQKDVDGMLKEIEKACRNPLKRENLLKRREDFAKSLMVNKYIELYK